MTDYEALSDRELIDAWENIHGILSLGSGPIEDLDDNAARLVLDKIAELGLQSEFISELKKLVICIFSNPRVCEFLDIQASARQKVIAALRAHDQLRAKESK